MRFRRLLRALWWLALIGLFLVDEYEVWVRRHFWRHVWGRYDRHRNETE